KLAQALGQGPVILFGAPEAHAGLRFRQDSDFFYVTGNDTLNAVLAMEAPSGRAHRFMPKRTETEIRYDGGNWLAESDAERRYGGATIQPLTALNEFLARRRTFNTERPWTRLSERDEVNLGRVDVAIHSARRRNSPFAQQPTED